MASDGVYGGEEADDCGLELFVILYGVPRTLVRTPPVSGLKPNTIGMNEMAFPRFGPALLRLEGRHLCLSKRGLRLQPVVGGTVCHTGATRSHCASARSVR